MEARGVGAINGTPLTAEPASFGPLGANGGTTQTMAPAEGSPVVDAGSATRAPPPGPAWAREAV